MSRPSNPDAEAALVARLLLDPRQIASVSGVVSPDDFTISEMRKAYGAMLRLSQQNRPIDITTIRQESGNGDLDIPVLQLTAAHHAPVEEYAAIVREMSVNRQIMDLSDDITRYVQIGDSDLVAEATARISELSASMAGMAHLGLLDLEGYRSPPPAPLLGVLSPEGTTVIYGDGGDGKGWIAASLAANLGKRVAILDFEGHPSEWAYRLDKFGLRFSDVLYAAPSVPMDRWANAASARLLRSRDIGFLLVDSAMYATNVDDPYSPATAMAYKQARMRLDNLPALLLAHIAKGGDTIYGSGFWKNEARIVWQLTKHPLTRVRSLECRKANNYPELEGTKLVIEFDEQNGILNLHPHGQPWSPQVVAEF